MKTQKGITLIALIITIIVMLILVGVSVSVALNTGLFKTTQGVAKNTQKASEKETEVSGGTINIGGTEISIDEYADRLSAAIPVELQVGDIIEYTPNSDTYTSSNTYKPTTFAGCSTTDGFYPGDLVPGTGHSELQWKVIAVEGSTIKIIPNAVSAGILKLEGANGWNNSIDVLNDVCGAVYGNAASDKYTATAESLTLEDIIEATEYTQSFATTGSYSASNYGNKNKFPIAYLEEKGVENITEEKDADGNGLGYAVNSTITLDTYCANPYPIESQTGFNTKFTNWVKLGTTYWLASQFIDAQPGGATFRVGYVAGSGHSAFSSLFLTDPIESPATLAVRPVVSLTLKVMPTLEKTEGEGANAINYWKFE